MEVHEVIDLTALVKMVGMMVVVEEVASVEVFEVVVWWRCWR